MLIEFRVKNHRSIREEQVLSMEAPNRELTSSSVSDSVLPAAALYGANASGKSNVLSALRFMRDAVVLSHRVWEPDEGVPRDPFAWGTTRSEPSLFEMTFFREGVRTEYGFVADDHRFLEEWLYVWPLGRKQVWFEREGDTFHFGENLKGENRLSQSVTRSNGLFLSAAVQNRHEQLVPVFRWFRRLRMHGVQPARFLSPEDAVRWLPTGDTDQQTLFPESSDEEVRRFKLVRSFIQEADVGILDIKLDASREESPERRRLRRSRILLRHRSVIPDAWLPLNEESHGTQKLFRLAPLVVDILQDGGTLVVDELEASFHPLLALHVVKTFNDLAKNPIRAQLIFSTHDTNLLGNTLGETPLRRDQVWLTEKSDAGSTVLYPLTDYKPRKSENLERGYLQGRYGAIPFLGDLASVGMSK